VLQNTSQAKGGNKSEEWEEKIKYL